MFFFIKKLYSEDACKHLTWTINFNQPRTEKPGYHHILNLHSAVNGQDKVIVS